jgi:anti-sigma B factor antagonist
VNPADEPPPFSVRRRDDETATVLSVAGDIDSDEAAALRRAAEEAIDVAAAAQPRRMFVLDLSDVTFIGSIGLSAVVQASVGAGRRGVDVRGVTGAGNRAVDRPLRLSGLVETAPWFATLDEALETPPSST